MKRKHIERSIAIVVITLYLLVVFGEGYAADPDVMLVVNPKSTEVYAGSGKIVITVDVSGENLTFTWQLKGPGKLEDEGAAAFYNPPEKIDQESASTVVTVTVKEQSGQETVKSVTFTILPAQSVDPEAEMWELVKNSTNILDIKVFLEAFPQGRFAKVAWLKREQIELAQAQAELSAINAPPLYDTFENPEHDGTFDQNLWISFNEGIGQIRQQKGILRISRMAKPDEELSLTPRQYRNFVIDHPLSFEAQLMVDTSQNSVVFMALQSDLSTDDYSDCFLETGNQEAGIGCSHNSRNKEVYDSDFKPVDYGTWHRVRITVDPSSMRFSYFIDGEGVGSYVPKNAEQLRETTFRFNIGIWGDSSDKLTGYIDEIRIGDGRM